MQLIRLFEDIMQNANEVCINVTNHVTIDVIALL